MSSSVSLAWSGCHVQVAGGGWSQLVGVPAGAEQRVVARLLELGASRAAVAEPGSVRFHAGRSVVAQLVAVFPCCPLS